MRRRLTSNTALFSALLSAAREKREVRHRMKRVRCTRRRCIRERECSRHVPSELLEHLPIDLVADVVDAAEEFFSADLVD